MKSTYTLKEINQYRETYTDNDGESAENYNLPGGWQIGCVLNGEMRLGSIWTAIKNTDHETFEQDIEIVKP